MTLAARARIVAALSLACCARTPDPHATQAEATPSAPTPSAGASAAPGAATDIVRTPAKTSSGGEIYELGQPRMRVSRGGVLGTLAIRTRSNHAITEYGGQLGVWDLSTGKPSTRIAPARGDSEPDVTFALSGDGELLATSSAMSVRLFRRPFERAEASAPTCYAVFAFSHSGQQLACRRAAPELWSVAQPKLLATPAKGTFVDKPRACGFSSDDKLLYCAAGHEITRWDPSTNAVTSVYKTQGSLWHASFNSQGTHLFVSETSPGAYGGGQAMLVELGSGHVTKLPGKLGGAVSANARVVALDEPGKVTAYDVATLKALWSVNRTDVVNRIAFSEDDKLLGFVSGNTIHIVDVTTGKERTYEAPSRFAGWLKGSVAAVERNGSVIELDLATGSQTKAAAAPRGLTPPAGAPAWGTWLADGPRGEVMVAEHDARHDAAFEERSTKECAPKLRVWTKSGGEKTLTLPCSKADDVVDPGWEIGGGVVVAVASNQVAIYDPKTGKRTGSISLPPPRRPKFAPTYANMALSSDGKYLALAWRRARPVDIGEADPRRDAMHNADAQASQQDECVSDSTGSCQIEAFVELWELGAKPRRVWQVHPEQTVGHEASPLLPSGAMTFDHRSSQLLVGFENGEIRAWKTTPDHAEHIEPLHAVAVSRLAFSPTDDWLFSEDHSGEQLVSRAR